MIQYLKILAAALVLILVVPLVCLWEWLLWPVLRRVLRDPLACWGEEGNWRRTKTFRFWGLAWRHSAVGFMRDATKSEEVAK